MRKAFLAVGWWLVSVTGVAALGLGQCHMGDNQGIAEIRWTYPSGEATWVTVEKERGKFDWSGLDAQVDKSKRQGQKIWIRVMTNAYGSVQTVPQWAVEAGVRSSGLNQPAPWDPLYMKFLSELLAAMRQRYEVDRWDQDVLPNGERVVEAVQIEVGSFGEMALDTSNNMPENFWLPEMAKYQSEIQGKTVTVDELKRTETGMLYDNFAKYYVESTKKIVDTYAETFRKLPVVYPSNSGLKVCLGS